MNKLAALLGAVVLAILPIVIVEHDVHDHAREVAFMTLLISDLGS